jgi:hypothetical protein
MQPSQHGVINFLIFRCLRDAELVLFHTCLLMLGLNCIIIVTEYNCRQMLISSRFLDFFALPRLQIFEQTSLTPSNACIEKLDCCRLVLCCLFLTQTEAFNTFYSGRLIRSHNPIAQRRTARLSAVKCAAQGNINQEQLWDRRTALAHFSISQLALFLSISQGSFVSAGSVYQAVAEGVTIFCPCNLHHPFSGIGIAVPGPPRVCF